MGYFTEMQSSAFFNQSYLSAILEEMKEFIFLRNAEVYYYSACHE